MDSYNLITILQDNDGRKELNISGEEYGLLFQSKRNRNSRLIDFGVISVQDLPAFEPVPPGYESCDSGYKILETELAVTYNSTDSCPSYVLLREVNVLPSAEPAVLVSVKSDSDNTDVSGRVLNPGETITLVVKVKIHRDFVGSLNRWLLILVDVHRKPNRTSFNTASVLCGVRIIGHVSSTTGRRSLSQDAKPFIPMSSLLYFDGPVAGLYCVDSICSVTMSPGFRAACLFSPVRHYPHPVMVEEYIRRGRSQDFLTICQRAGIFVRNEPTGQRYGPIGSTEDSSHSSHAAWNIASEPAARVHLAVVRNLLWLEEVHMTMDIAQHDMTFVSCKFREHKIIGYDMVAHVRLTVNGSNESRPRIAVGDTIRMRPMAEDLANECARLRVEFFTFELMGKIISYSLKDESCICEFSLPLNSPLTPISESDVLRSWTNMRYVARFTFERFGMEFAHRAINAVLERSELLNALFPNVPSPVTMAVESLQDPIRTTSTSSTSSLFSEDVGDWPDLTKPVQVSEPIGAKVTSPARRAAAPLSMQLSPLLLTTGKGSRSKAMPLNEEQCEAISRIVELCWPSARQGMLPPFLLFGPPGTGKTCTLIKAIVEVATRYPSKRILACAPSDAAADVLCMRLSENEHFYKDNMLRLNWWQRIADSVPPSLRQFCCFSEATSEGKEPRYDLPKLKRLLKYTVIVCTCGTAGVVREALSQLPGGIAPALFDLVLIDEASQATEAESLVAASLCKKTGLVVLAGDPKQLGPSVRSPVHSVWGGPISMQERLLFAMQAHGESPAVKVGDLEMVVRLTKNYRSHGALLTVPSKLFYRNELQEMARVENSHSLVAWDRLSKTTASFPLLFIGVDGRHEHALDSPSFHNDAECSEIVNVCSQLLRSSDIVVQRNDIGVICAFRSQVLKVRLALREKNLGNINVGSVEDYQGQEVKIIIVSTVLTARVPSFETKGGCGLFMDARRFNVAVTRGMALCVVIGQPHLLRQDPCWREFMQHCHQHGAMTGFSAGVFDGDGEESNDIAVAGDRLTSLDSAHLDHIAQLSLQGDRPTGVDVGNYFDTETQWKIML